MIKIGLIEDDKLLNESLSILLSKEGYKIYRGYSLADGRKLLEEEYVKVAYIDYSGNVMSRYFMPTVSKGKYFSESYKDIIGSKKLILTSLIETETNIEELEQLENLIRKKKEELKE